MNKFTEANKPILALAPASQSPGSAINGSLGGTSGWIDTLGYESVAFVFQFGAVSDTISDLDLKVYENEGVTGNGDAISGAEKLNLTGAAVDNQTYQIEVRCDGRAAGTRKRYMRPQITPTGSGTVLCSVTAILANGQSVPVTQQNTAVVV